MNRRSFMAALLAVPFVPVAPKQAKAAINPAWAAKPVPDGFAAIYGVNSIDIGNVDISNAYIGNLHVSESCVTGYRVYDPRAKRASILMDVPAGEYPKAIKLSDLKLR